MKITMSIPNQIVKILQDENVIREIYAEMYDYYKNKEGKAGITLSRTVRIILAKYLMEKGYITTPLM